MYDDYGADRFVPLGINLWQDMNSVVKYYARQYTYPFFRDGGSVWNTYKMNSYIPLNYVIDPDGNVLYSQEGFSESVIRAYIESVLPPTGVNEGKTGDALRILSSGPNPAREPAMLRYSLPKAGDVELRVYSGSGNLVRSTRLDGRAGVNTFTWDLRDDDGSAVANGMYFVELASSGSAVHAKVAVLK